MHHDNHGVTGSANLLRNLKSINTAINEGENRLSLANKLTQACLEYSCLDGVWLWSWQETSGQMIRESSAGIEAPLQEILDSFKGSSSVSMHLIVGHEVILDWAEIWGDTAHAFVDADFKQVGVLPLMAGNSLVGAMGFAGKSDQEFDPRLLDSLRHILMFYGSRLEVLNLEERLAIHNQNMGELIEANETPLFIVDENGIIQNTGKPGQIAESSGKSIDTVLPGGLRILRKFCDHIPVDKAAGEDRKFSQSRLLGKDGRLTPVDVTIKKGMWDGREAYFISCRDISQQLVIEKERDRLVTAIEQAADSIVITNSSGSIQYTNPAFTRMTGYTAEEVLGKNPRILKSFRHDKEFYRQMWSTIRRGDTWNGRMMNTRKSGEKYWETASISPVRDSSGIITHYVGVKHDITHELDLEEKLRQSQKLEAIGTLAGGIAHDFNNILYALLGNSQLALDDIPKDHPAHLPLKEIVKAGDRGSALVAKMLAFGQRAEGQMVVRPLGPIITEVMELSRASLPTTIEIRMDLAEDCAEMLLDETQIHQVVLNLCTNAAHAMRGGGGVLTLGLRQITVKEDTPEDILGVVPGDYLRLTFSDTGCGMDAAVTDRIFEPYFTTKKPNEGTGLGLASVHGIVRNHDGQIFVDSTPEGGTTFTIFFPTAEQGVAPEEIKLQEERPLTGQARVMVVDDEAMITDVVVRGLEKKGFQVMGFTDGIEALEVFRKSPEAFDVVITDQTMPGITGFELAAHLSSIRPDLPIILSTGYANTVNECELRTAGVSHFLSKPLKIKELAALLCELDKPVLSVKGV